MMTLTNRVKKLEKKVTPRETWLQSGQHEGYQISEEERAEVIRILIQYGAVREISRTNDAS